MRNQVTSQTGAGNSSPLVMDTNGLPMVSLQVVVTGTVNYTVQQTLDNLFDTSITATWFDHPDANLVAATASKQGNYAYVPFGVRVKVNSGSGSATLTAICAGIGGV